MQEKKLTECEVMVMRCIWDSKGELSKEEVRELANIRFRKNWKGETVSTFLQRLVKKGYIQTWRKGRVFLYKALVDAEECQMENLQHILALWYGDGLTVFADHADRLVKQKVKITVK